MNPKLFKSAKWWAGVIASLVLVFGDHTWQTMIGIPPEAQMVIKGIGAMLLLLLSSPAVKQLTEADRETLPPVTVTGKGAVVPVEERTSLPPGAP